MQLRKPMLVGVGTMLGVLGAASSAVAAAPPRGAVVHRMKVVGVDRAVAAAHGFAVKVAPDGTRYATRPGVVSPQDNVEQGDCGSSWVFVDPQGGYWSTIRTGFAVDQAAVAYYWKVNRSDPYGATQNTWGGGLDFDYTWQGAWNVQGGGSGWETAGVTPDSDALLWDGDICSSAGPTDTEYVY